jgi:hypothetical protein
MCRRKRKELWGKHSLIHIKFWFVDNSHIIEHCPFGSPTPSTSPPSAPKQKDPSLLLSWRYSTVSPYDEHIREWGTIVCVCVCIQIRILFLERFVAFALFFDMMKITGYVKRKLELCGRHKCNSASSVIWSPLYFIAGRNNPGTRWSGG